MSSKFYDPDESEKRKQNYWCLWREMIENKSIYISTACMKWHRRGAA